MKNILKSFIDLEHNQNFILVNNYLSSFKNSLLLSTFLFKSSIKELIHGFIPFFYNDCKNDVYHELAKILNINAENNMDGTASSSPSDPENNDDGNNDDGNKNNENTNSKQNEPGYNKTKKNYYDLNM